MKPTQHPRVIAKARRNGESIRSIAARNGVAMDTIRMRLIEAGYTTNGDDAAPGKPTRLPDWTPPAAYQASEHWTDDALCRQTDPNIFFPESDGDNGATAKAICRKCEVRSECLEEALALPQQDDMHGVRGGLSRNQRTQLRNRLRRTA